MNYINSSAVPKYLCKLKQDIDFIEWVVMQVQLPDNGSVSLKLYICSAYRKKMSQPGKHEMYTLVISNIYWVVSMYTLVACDVFFNTLRPRQNGCHFRDETFKRIFLNENIRLSIKISLNIVP